MFAHTLVDRFMESKEKDFLLGDAMTPMQAEWCWPPSWHPEGPVDVPADIFLDIPKDQGNLKVKTALGEPHRPEIFSLHDQLI